MSQEARGERGEARGEGGEARGVVKVAGAPVGSPGARPRKRGVLWGAGEKVGVGGMPGRCGTVSLSALSVERVAATGDPGKLPRRGAPLWAPTSSGAGDDHQGSEGRGWR